MLKKLFGKNNGLVLPAVCDGEVVELSQVSDPVFAEKMMGEGFAIIPSKGEIVAPFDGEISLVIDTKHAVTIMSKDGLEVLIHVGIDTVKLNGKHFENKVSTGDSVKKGDVLTVFDIEGIKSEGYSITTPVIIVNTDEYSSFEFANKGNISALENVLNINK